jgi:hypothetical protein
MTFITFPWMAMSSWAGFDGFFGVGVGVGVGIGFVAGLGTRGAVFGVGLGTGFGAGGAGFWAGF